MVAPFVGLKSTSAFPVTQKPATGLSTLPSNGGRVQCMKVWPIVGLKKFETLSYLPTLSVEALLKQIEYLRGATATAFAAFSLPHRLPLPHRRRLLPPRSSLSDPLVLKIADRLEDSLPLSPSPALQPLRDSAALSLLSTRWPTPKDEPFRFTDTSFIKSADILPAPPPAGGASAVSTSAFSNLLVLIDGHLSLPLSRLSSLPEGAYAGPLSAIPQSPLLDSVLAAVNSNTGDLFSDLNAAGAPDVTVLYVPCGVSLVEEPVHVMFCSAEGADVGTGRMPLSSPRMVVVVEKGSEVAILEEYVGIGGSEERCYWANSVMEIVIGEGGKMSHCYVQRQSLNAAHIKWTFARQESSSIYELIEVSTGGKLSRHNLHIQQLGPDTITELSAFHVSQKDQTQDLHSKLVLDHPRGYSRQLHKCIVSHSSGQAVFDGNIKVNRYAQQTDAGQLTRTLLLAPRATANVKPNLQIVADNVKCSHGAAISDLEEEQLFYFRARGVDPQTARDALLFSFGAEVLSKIPFDPVRKSVSKQIKELLASERGKG